MGVLPALRGQGAGPGDRAHGPAVPLVSEALELSAGLRARRDVRVEAALRAGQGSFCRRSHNAHCSLDLSNRANKCVRITESKREGD